jgi:hypothetical protein
MYWEGYINTILYARAWSQDSGYNGSKGRQSHDGALMFYSILSESTLLLRLQISGAKLDEAR